MQLLFIFNLLLTTRWGCRNWSNFQTFLPSMFEMRLEDPWILISGSVWDRERFVVFEISVKTHTMTPKKWTCAAFDTFSSHIDTQTRQEESRSALLFLVRCEILILFCCAVVYMLIIKYETCQIHVSYFRVYVPHIWLCNEQTFSFNISPILLIQNPCQLSDMFSPKNMK